MRSLNPDYIIGLAVHYWWVPALLIAALALIKVARGIGLIVERYREHQLWRRRAANAAAEAAQRQCQQGG